MKTITTYIIALSTGLYLSIGTASAQSGSEIRFNTFGKTIDTSLVMVSATVNPKQSISMDGIHFSIIVRNNSGNSITIKNISDLLYLALYNERGLDIAIENMSMAPINRKDRSWKFRSEAVSPDKAYINGKDEKSDLKQLEYVEIPARGKYLINLMLKNVKDVKNSKDVQDRYLKPTVKLASGKYRLKMWLSIFLKERNSSGSSRIAGFESPMIDIEYGK